MIIKTDTMTGLNHRRDTFEASAFEGRVYRDVVFDFAHLGRAEFKDCRFERCSFTRARFGPTRGQEAQTFAGCHFEHCDMTGAQLRKGSFEDCMFYSCWLEGADMYQVSLVSTAFLCCELKGAMMRSALLDDVIFDQCNMQGVDMGSMQHRQLEFRSPASHAICMSGSSHMPKGLDANKLLQEGFVSGPLLQELTRRYCNTYLSALRDGHAHQQMCAKPVPWSSSTCESCGRGTSTKYDTGLQEASK